jgi:hypothetical protein
MDAQLRLLHLRRRALQQRLHLPRRGGHRGGLPGAPGTPAPRRPAGQGRLAAARRHRQRGVDAERLGAAAPGRRGRAGRLPVRLRPRLRQRAAGAGAAHRAVTASAGVPVRGVVLPVLRVHHRRLRELAGPGLPLAPRAAGHALGGHQLEVT